MERIDEKLHTGLKAAENDRDNTIYVFHPPYHENEKVRNLLESVLEDHLDNLFTEEELDEALEAHDELVIRRGVKFLFNNHDEPFVFFYGKIKGIPISGLFHVITEHSELKHGRYTSEKSYEAVLRDPKGALLIGRRIITNSTEKRRVPKRAMLYLRYSREGKINLQKIVEDEKGDEEVVKLSNEEKMLKGALDKIAERLGIKSVIAHVSYSQYYGRGKKTVLFRTSHFKTRVLTPSEDQTRFNTLIINLLEELFRDNPRWKDYLKELEEV